jgi:hypothetical protein
MNLMITSYLLLKLLHVLFAIAGVGFTSTFGLTMALAAGHQGALPFALKLVHRLSSIATPCLIGLILTGLGMAWTGNLQWTALWMIASLALALVVLGAILLVAKPNLVRQLELVKQSPPPVDELARRGARSKKVGALLSLAALTIIALMVFKPVL